MPVNNAARSEYWMTPRCVKAVSPSVSLSFNCRKITAALKVFVLSLAQLSSSASRIGGSSAAGIRWILMSEKPKMGAA